MTTPSSFACFIMFCSDALNNGSLLWVYMNMLSTGPVWLFVALGTTAALLPDLLIGVWEAYSAGDGVLVNQVSFHDFILLYLLLLFVHLSRLITFHQIIRANRWTSVTHWFARISCYIPNLLMHISAGLLARCSRKESIEPCRYCLNRALADCKWTRS